MRSWLIYLDAGDGDHDGLGRNHNAAEFSSAVEDDHSVFEGGGQLGQIDTELAAAIRVDGVCTGARLVWKQAVQGAFYDDGRGYGEAASAIEHQSKNAGNLLWGAACASQTGQHEECRPGASNG